ncbi:MAG: MG2 domain-containing protein [Treponema sp.]
MSFECSESVIPQKAYTVKISRKLTSASGKKISGSTEYYFHSEKLQLLNIVPGYGEVQKGNYVDNNEVPVEVARDIALYFNSPVNVKTIEKEIKVTDEKKEELQFTASKIEDTIVRLALKKAPLENNLIVITLPKNSMADENCFATTEDQTQEFHTIKPLSITSLDNDPQYLDSSFANPVQATFNHLMKTGSEADVAKCISTEPKMEVTAKNISVSGTTIVVHSLPVDYESTYKISFSNSITDAYGMKLSEGATFDVTVPKAASFVYFKDYGNGILESQFAAKIAFEYQNMVQKNSFYQIAPLTKANGERSEKKYIEKKYGSEPLPKNKKVVEVADLCPALEKVGDEYRGAAQFYAKINYLYRYKDWQTNETVEEEEDTENTQVIQVTDLGVTVRYAYNKALVLVTSLKTGLPIKNATVTGYGISWDKGQSNVVVDDHVPISKTTTDEHGFASMDIPDATMKNLKNDKKNFYIEAKTDNDRVIFNPNINSMWRTAAVNVSSPSEAQDSEMVTFIFTDRGLYKPGETMKFRGIDRTLKAGKYYTYQGGYRIQFNDGAWQPKVYGTQTDYTSSNGTFYGEWKIPEDLTPGTYTISYKRNKGENTDRSSSITFQVQFFERLRFEASSSIPSLTYFSGDTLNAEVKAQYLDGGSLAGSTYTSYWSREPAGFAPKGTKFDGMRFGPLQGYDGRTSLNETSSALSGDGRSNSSQQTGGEKLKGMAYYYRVETQVTDSGNQMIGTTTNAIVHPAKFYLGVSKIKGITGFPKKGDTLKFDYVCTTPDGNVPSAKDIPSSENKKIKVELLREDWKEVQQLAWNGQINTRYVREMVTEEEKNISLEATENKTEFSVVPPKGGAYLLRLSTKDSRGNDVITETRFYVISSDWTWFDRDNADEITMTCDKEEYEVGETAHILMQSPLAKGTYMMTVEREGIVSNEIREITEPTTVLDVKVEKDFVPIMYVTLSLYSTRTSEPSKDFNTPDLGKPKGYFGLAAIHVNPSPMKFDIEIKTDKATYRPGETAKISLHASKDSAPLSNAEITLMAVDRGVIDLINYHVADPVAYFYDEGLFPDCVKGGDSRSLLIDPVMYEAKNLVGGDSAESSSKLEERKNFEPTALFVPDLITDENGDVSCEFTLPDSLTAYRITAVGVSKNYFSLGESEMPVANPISVRDVLPRKLRLNDEGEVGVTISNLDNVAHNVTVSLNVEDGLSRIENAQSEDDVQKLPGKASVIGEPEKIITVEPNTTKALMFKVDAEKQGWFTVAFTVQSDVVNEVILKPLEIEKPYIYETVTTVGEVRSEEDAKDKKASVTEKILIPQSAEDGKGSLNIQLESSHLGVLKEAVDYVFNYPFGCLEQRSSFVMPLVAFGDYIKVLGLDSKVKSSKSVAKKEIASWAKCQLSDGGFPYWPDGNRSSLFVSLRIGEIIALAEEKGISITDKINKSKLADYIQYESQKNYPDYETSAYYTYMRSYSSYVVQRLGKNVPDADLKSLVDSKAADLDSLTFCALTYLEKNEISKAQDIAKLIKRYTKLSTRGVDLTSKQKQFHYWSYFNGKAEDYALLLTLYSKLDPTDRINQHIVYELLELEKAGKGYWQSTAVTTRVLCAFDVYIRANDLTSTDFTAEALLNGKKFVDGKFKGLKETSAEKTVDLQEEPVKSLARDKELPVEFNKDGNGTLFYTVSMKYVIPVTEQTARDEGICLFTEITDVKTGEVVSENNLVAGNIYKEKVFVTSTRDRQYVAVRAPIPAGCEVMNAAFVTTGTVPQKSEEKDSAVTVDSYSYNGYDDSYYWYEDENYGLSYQAIYDSEVQYFWNLFPKGNQQVEFLFRAARKGTYNTPSGTAECMYQPEVFGRSAGKVWTVK